LLISERRKKKEATIIEIDVLSHQLSSKLVFTPANNVNKIVKNYLNPKIYTRSHVDTSIDNKARKKLLD
jgi:hypothetical protein